MIHLQTNENHGSLSQDLGVESRVSILKKVAIEPLLYPKRYAAAILNVTVKQFDVLAKNAGISGKKLGARIMFKRSDLDIIIESLADVDAE